MNPEDTKSLKTLMNALKSDNLTSEEFVASFEKVMEYVKSAHEMTKAEMEKIAETIGKSFDSLKEKHMQYDSKLASFEQTQQDAWGSLSEHASGLMKQMQDKMDELVVDEDRVIKEVKKGIKIPEPKQMPANEIRNSLEHLTGTERLDVSAIKGIKDVIKGTQGARVIATRTPSPLMTKGDILTYSIYEARLPVGTDGDVLVADSTTTLGIKWGASIGSPAGINAGINVQTLTANITLTAGTDPMYQYLDPSTASWDITLDTASASAGDRFVIKNNDVYTSSHYLTIYQGTTALDYIYAQGSKVFIFDGTDWQGADNGVKDYNVTVGYNANAYLYGVAIGRNTNAFSYGAAVGVNAQGYTGGAAVGNNANGTNYGSALGYYAGSGQTGSQNINIGQNVTSPTLAGNQQLNIGNVLYGTGMYNGTSISSVPLATGNLGIGLTTPTARLHLPAGTATASTAPLKLTSGTNLTTVEDGAIEYDGTHIYASIGTTRYQLDQQPDAVTSVNGLTGAVVLTTDEITEGTTNLYYTEARVSANTDVTANTAKVTESTTASAPLVLTGYDISIPASTTTVDGYLTAVDWTTFNGKANAGANSDITSLAGLTTALSVAQGGTGATTLTGVVIGTGTTAMTVKTNPAGAFVGDTDTQTLTNKTIDNTNAVTLLSTEFTLQDATDATKQGVFDLSLITTATTRTLTIQDKSYTLADNADLHDAVTIGTANGLSLSTQVLSLATATSLVTGALTSTDWTTFNDKANAGANTDITSIGGLTTALSVAQGGTGATTLTGMLKGTGTTAFAVATDGTDYISSVSADTAPALGGELNAGAHSIGFTLQTYTGVVGTTTIDLTAGNKIQFTFGAGDETLAFTAPTNPGNFVLYMIQDATGGRLATWPTTCRWAGGTAPTLSTAANTVDIISFVWNGTNYDCVASLAFA